jgi:hypothetical protein
MTPEQFQQIHSMLSELVENRRESLALQREALKFQQEGLANAREATKKSLRFLDMWQNWFKILLVGGLIAIGVLIALQVMKR